MASKPTHNNTINYHLKKTIVLLNSLGILESNTNFEEIKSGLFHVREEVRCCMGSAAAVSFSLSPFLSMIA